jgi:hypothetical protein
LFETLVEALTPRLVAITFHSPFSSGGGEEDLELSAAYLHALLEAIKRALAGKVDEGHADVAGYADSLAPVLYRLCIVYMRRYMTGAGDRRARGVVGDIIGLVVQSLVPTSVPSIALLTDEMFVNEGCMIGGSRVLSPAFLTRGRLLPSRTLL